MKTYTEYSTSLDIVSKRTLDHIERVKYFYDVLKSKGFISDADDITSDVAKHDEDKLYIANMKRQALRFQNGGQLTAEEEKIINDVIREHVKSNPHHCEYWGKPEEDHLSKGIHCENMPDKYIYEMMADWASTAEERGTKIIDWYNKCVGDRWFFSDHQKEVMLRCIDCLEQFVEHQRKRNYGASIIDPAVKQN